MPLGNGPTRGLPSQPLGVLSDPRTYYRPWTTSPYAFTDENPIAPPAAFGAKGGFMSPYARAVAATPGLMHWWRFGKALTFGADNPNYANSAGPTTLRSQSAATKLGVGLIPGDTDPSCDLNGGYLDAWDYRVFSTSNEPMSAEIWVKFRSLKSDVGIIGEWGSNVGWMLYTANTSGDLALYIGDTHFTAAAALKVGLNHIVGCWGGNDNSGGRSPDYYSRLYVNGVNVASSLTATASGNPNNSSIRFEIGNYSNGGGTNNLDGLVDEAAVYSRMLQPEEVRQHYQAAFARG